MCYILYIDMWCNWLFCRYYQALQLFLELTHVSLIVIVGNVFAQPPFLWLRLQIRPLKILRNNTLNNNEFYWWKNFYNRSSRSWNYFRQTHKHYFFIKLYCWIFPRTEVPISKLRWFVGGLLNLGIVMYSISICNKSL